MLGTQVLVKVHAPGVRFFASDKVFSALIDNTKNTAFPSVGPSRDFVWINPIEDGSRTIGCRTNQAQRFPESRAYFDLAAADEFVTATANALIIERFPFSQWI